MLYWHLTLGSDVCFTIIDVAVDRQQAWRGKGKSKKGKVDNTTILPKR